jgi:hypothetical protein
MLRDEPGVWASDRSCTAVDVVGVNLHRNCLIQALHLDDQLVATGRNPQQAPLRAHEINSTCFSWRLRVLTAYHCLS